MGQGFLVGHTGNAAGLLLRDFQRGHEDGHENGDHGDHDEQLDESKGLVLVHDALLPKHIRIVRSFLYSF